MLKPKTCDSRKGGCGAEFTPARPMQKACSPQCAQNFAAHRAARAEALRMREDKARTRVALESLKDIPKLKKEAQHALNRWIRWRDRDSPCISCGAPPPNLNALHAGRDAGHYRSTGSADHLRFHEDNVHAQCVSCNQWGAGRVVEYRRGLVERIGIDRVQSLECDNQRQKWTREGLRAIRDEYRARWAQRGEN